MIGSASSQGLSKEGVVMVVENLVMEIENEARLVSLTKRNGAWFEETDNGLGKP